VAEIEAAIRDRQQHLSATLDELSRRLQPSALAQAATADVRQSARSLVVDPASGGLRVERLVAVGAAVAVLVVLSIVARVRVRRRSGD
jgi:hypothetical protein